MVLHGIHYKLIGSLILSVCFLSAQVDILTRQYFQTQYRAGNPGAYILKDAAGNQHKFQIVGSGAGTTWNFFPIAPGSSGQCWGWVSAYTFGWVPCSGGGGGGAPSGPAGGDLSGTYPNPSTYAINGATLGITTPTTGNLLVPNGTSWRTRPVAGDLSMDVSGIFTIGSLAGAPLGITTPSSGNIFIANGTTWRSRPVSGDVSIDLSGVVSLFNTLGSPGACGDSTHSCSITYDTKGRITSVANALIIGGSPTGTAGGDLSGTYPNPTVAKINGNSLGNTSPSAANILIASGSAWESRALSGDAFITTLGVLNLASIIAPGTCGSSTFSCQVSYDGKGRITAISNIPISGGSPTGSAGGDLSGTYPNPLVAKWLTAPLGTTTPTNANHMIADGTAWYSRSISGDVTINNTGVATLSTVNGSPGTCGDATHVCQITTNAKGLTTSQTPVLISGGGGGGSSTLILSRVNKTANYTLTGSDFAVNCDATSGAVVIAMPNSPNDGQVFSIGKIDSTVNFCVVTGNGHTINGVSSLTVDTQYINMLFQYDATAGIWRVI